MPAPRNRAELLELLNSNNIPSHLNDIQLALLGEITEQIMGPQEEGPLSHEQMVRADQELLNSVGPAAADAAVAYTVNTLQVMNKASGLTFNCDPVHNAQLVSNDPGVYPSFSQTLRQFLLPRSAYFDFDSLVDPRHKIDYECGYPRWITPAMYRYLYDRDDVSRRVVDIYPDESWAVDPEVYETEEAEDWTPFELAWKQLSEDHDLMQKLYRLDKLSGVGHYGVLLYQLDDGRPLDEPVDEPELLSGLPNPTARKQRKLLGVRPFDEYLSFITEYDRDVNSPRYGLPVYYNLVFLDMTVNAAGSAVGSRLNRRVHWSRVEHVADTLESSDVFGVPRMKPVFNRLLDLRKIKGGSSEMFWKGAFPGIAFEIDPSVVADDPDFDKDAFRREVDEYASGLKRYLSLLGVKANSLTPQVSDPSKHVKVQIEAVASHCGIPSRIFMGSEESRLASSQDKLTWNQRLLRRLKFSTEPMIRRVVRRLIAFGVLPVPSVKDKQTGLTGFHVGWGDLNTTTDEDKANLALKWSQAMSQYVASGLVHLIGPLDYLMLIVGMRPRDALRIASSANLETLKKVDPSKGAGANGKRQNMAGDAPDKRSSGMKG